MLDKSETAKLDEAIDPSLLARFAAIVGDKYAITDPSLPLIKLPAPVPGVVVKPPIVLPVAPELISTPVPLVTAAVPAALVPIKFPWTRLSVVLAPANSTPARALPEITLPAPATLPPTELPEPLSK